MEKRSVMIAFPGAAAPSEIQSDASTWGELKKELLDQLDQDFYNQKVRDHKTNHHYNDDAAVLADEPLKLLVSTDKNKSGMPVNKANYHKASYADLRTFCKKMTGFAPNGKQLCLDALNEHYSYGGVVKKAKPTTVTKKVAPKNKTTKVKVPVVAKKTIEQRVVALEEKVFGNNVKEVEPDPDGFLAAARELA